LVFGIYGSRKREEEDTVTFASGCLVKEKNLGTDWTHWKQKGEGIRELGTDILEVLRELLGVRGRRKRRTTSRGIMVLCSC